MMAATDKYATGVLSLDNPDNSDNTQGHGTCASPCDVQRLTLWQPHVIGAM